MAKRYEPCEQVIEVFPAWTTCGRPAPIPRTGQARCELHPVKRIWPTDDLLGPANRDHNPEAVRQWADAEIEAAAVKEVFERHFGQAVANEVRIEVKGEPAGPANNYQGSLF